MEDFFVHITQGKIATLRTASKMPHCLITHDRGHMPDQRNEEAYHPTVQEWDNPINIATANVLL